MFDENLPPIAVNSIDVPADTAPLVRRRWRRWLIGCLGIVIAGGLIYLGVRVGTGRRATAGTGSAKTHVNSGIPVNTITPVKKSLVRTLEQPGSIRPLAQGELYAKASGYVKFIQRDFAASGTMLPIEAPKYAPPGIGELIQVIVLHRAVRLAPQKDIGSRVRAGEIVMQLDVPESAQDVLQKEALYLQAEAELRQARTALGTFEASVKAAESQQKQAEADIRRYASEHASQSLQLKRLEDLLRDRIGTQEGVDERRNLVNAALAAWESSQAKAQTAKADLLVVSSKLAAARDDLLVKEARVRVAREDLRRAQVVADYANIRATIDGVITYRAVDEGDFVQNSSSGQGRHVMTVAAIDKVKVVVQVPEREAPWVKVGAAATVRMDARSGWEARGTVSRTSGSLDNQSRTMQIEIDLDNKDHLLLPGMYGQVVVTLQSIENAQAIPANAVYSRRGENYILVVHDGIAHRERVRIQYDDGKELKVVRLVGNREVPLDGTEELIVSNKGEIAEGQRVHATRIGAGGSATRGLATP